jgi:NAD(P)-dependent dehydrogenase (short-subunit alcohol dehydrogenase family)
VTGAAGGIGQALVHAFADAGYKVIGTDRTPAPTSSPCSLWIEADLEQTTVDAAHAADVMAGIRAHVGTGVLRGLVNNAALQLLGGIDALTRDDWLRTLNVNLLAPFLWTQSLLPELEAARGCVVNVSSVHARLTKKNFVAYATSKAALSGMTRALAVDVGDRIRVNAIEPAAIKTPMLVAGFDGKPDLFAQVGAAHPAGRIGSADEVANLAVALCDGKLGFVNGACIPIDGGIGARLHDPD